MTNVQWATLTQICFKISCYRVFKLSIFRHFIVAILIFCDYACFTESGLCYKLFYLNEIDLDWEEFLD